MPQITGESLSLYFHLPFCQKKCGYCAFSSTDQFDQDLIKRYLSHCLTKYSNAIEQLQPTSIKTLYFGGGTPSLVPAPLLVSLIEQLREISVKNNVIFEPLEISIEVNPGSVTDEWVAQLLSAGVNRMTLGIQSFDRSLLTQIQRSNNASFQRLTDLSYQIKSSQAQLGIDIITAIPGETTQQAIYDIQQGLSLAPDHLSLYSLSIEPGTPLETSLKGKLTDDIQEMGELAELAAVSELKKSGYEHYEVSNFCQHRCESQHNLTYWKMDNSLAIGTSAVSTLHNYDMPLHQTKKRVIRLTETSSIQQWLSGKPAEISEISRHDFIFENFMMGFRLKSGIKISRFENRFNANPKEIAPLFFSDAEKRGDIIIQSNRMFLPPDRQLFLNSFLVKLMDELALN